MNINQDEVIVQDVEIEYNGVHSNTTRLTLINVTFNPKFTILEGIPHLRFVHLENIEIEQIVGEWPLLEEITIRNCNIITHFEINAPCLTSLHLRSNPILTNFNVYDNDILSVIIICECRSFQKTNFTYPNLYKLKYADCDITELQINCPSLSMLYLVRLLKLNVLHPITSFGMSHFVIENCPIIELDLVTPCIQMVRIINTNLVRLRLNSRSLHNAYVSDCNVLQDVKIQSEWLEEINFTGNNSLVMVQIEASKLHSVTINNSPVSKLDLNTKKLNYVRLNGTNFPSDGILLVLLKDNPEIQMFHFRSSVVNNSFGFYHRVLDELVLMYDGPLEGEGEPYPPLRVDAMYFDIFQIPLQRRITIFKLLDSVERYGVRDSILPISEGLGFFFNPSRHEIEVMETWRNRIHIERPLLHAF